MPAPKITTRPFSRCLRGPQRNVRFGDLSHGDRGLHPGRDAFLFQEVLQRKAVHHGAEHAHVVAAGALHAALLQLGATEEVAAPDDDGDLHATADHLGDLPGHLVHDVGVQPHLATAEHLAAELEQHAGVHRPDWWWFDAVVAGELGVRHPTPSGSSHEIALNPAP